MVEKYIKYLFVFIIGIGFGYFWCYNALMP